MKKLIVVRHGEYLNGRLSGHGQIQIEKLAEKLKALVVGESMLIFSSNAERARESAEIIGKAFDAQIEVCEELYSDEDHPVNLPWALELVKSNMGKADVIVLVTHFEYVGEFPSYYVEKELGMKAHSWEIEKGGAWFVDCAAKELIHVWPM
jgi:phosphohistidine phosphatase SixA